MPQPSNYPPGCAFSVHEFMYVFRCQNPECPQFETTWEAPGFRELGGCFMHDDDQRGCPTCGEEGKDIT